MLEQIKYKINIFRQLSICAGYLLLAIITWGFVSQGMTGSGYSVGAGTIYSPLRGTLESPVENDTFMIGNSDMLLTITGVDCIVEDATSAVLTVQECDANGNSCTTIESLTCLTTLVSDNGVDDSSVAAGNMLRVTVGTVTGTVGHINWTVHATHN